MKKSKAPERRKRVLVDPQFEMAVAGRIVGLLALYMLLFFVISVMVPVAIGFAKGESVWGASQSMARLDMFLHGILLPLLLTFGFIFWQSLRETNRIAGPNYRFRNVFQRLICRQIPRGVRVREADYLQNTADALDQSLITLHDDMAALQALGRDARQALERGVPDAPVASPDLEEAVRLVKDITDRLDSFELVTRAPACQPLGEPQEPLPQVEPAAASAD